MAIVENYRGHLLNLEIWTRISLLFFLIINIVDHTFSNSLIIHKVASQ